MSFSELNVSVLTDVSNIVQKRKMREATTYGCWNVAKVDIFIMLYIHVTWSFVFVIYFIFMLYVYHIFISIFTLFDFKFVW